MSFKPSFEHYTVFPELVNYDTLLNNDENSRAIVKQVKKSSYLDGPKQALVYRVNEMVTLTILNLTPWKIDLERITIKGEAKLQVNNKLLAYFTPDSCHILLYNKEDKKLVFIEKDDDKSSIIKHKLKDTGDSSWSHQEQSKTLVP